MHRRQFLLSASLGGLALADAKFGMGEPLVKKFGVQFFSIPKLLQQDFRRTVTSLATMGYREVEPYGPYPFSAPEAIAQWNAVTPQLGFSGSGFFGLSASEFRSVLNDHQITAPSMHTDLLTLQTRMSELSGPAHAIGATNVVLPAIPQEKRKSLDDYKKMADAFNAIGNDARREGLKFAYHNHGYGLHEMDGQIPLKIILDGTDPALVFPEMDIFWTTAGGASPVDYLKDYPGRYHLMHVKDMKELVRFKGDGGNPAQWIELFPYITSVGNGVLDIKSILAQAQKSGVKHFFVEQDIAADPMVDLQRSVKFLEKL